MTSQLGTASLGGVHSSHSGCEDLPGRQPLPGSLPGLKSMQVTSGHGPSTAEGGERREETDGCLQNARTLGAQQTRATLANWQRSSSHITEGCAEAERKQEAGFREPTFSVVPRPTPAEENTAPM